MDNDDPRLRDVASIRRVLDAMRVASPSVRTACEIRVFYGEKPDAALILQEIALSTMLSKSRHVRHEGSDSQSINKTTTPTTGRIAPAKLPRKRAPRNVALADFYSCFISYSTTDQEFAERVHNDLQANGVRCWYAPHDAKGGLKLNDQIDQAIRLHEKLLLILSPNSMQSDWVKAEVAKARAREIREGVQSLFPIRLCSYSELESWRCFDTGTGKDHAPEIRDYLIPDFSNWTDPKSYQAAFAKLLRDFKPTSAVGA
jgi:hypothetical protein